jgi:hypothetical protein
MKKLLTLLLIITFQINAQEPDCEEGHLEAMATQLALPNYLEQNNARKDWVILPKINQAQE